MRPVTTPPGSSLGASIVRAARSDQSSTPAPPNAESGSTRRFDPSSRRTRCGTTRPTKPTRPATLAAEPASSDAAANASSRVRSTGTQDERQRESRR